MKKVIIVLVLLIAVGGGVAAFFLLGKIFTQSQVKDRLQALFDAADAFRAGFGVNESELLSYFDRGQYDPNVMSPESWTWKWRQENSDQRLRRKLKEVNFLKTTKSEVEAEFTVDEGDPGDEKFGHPANMKPYRYRAVLVYNKERQDWLLRSLESLTE
ncbi:MAG: hypothetical protein ACYS47_09365 [Planctomycetota bacterium]|jgi:hypothetical protein